MNEAPNTAATKPRRRWYQYRLRTLLVAVTLVGCGMGWLGFKIRIAARQEADVAALVKLGGSVEYDYDTDGHGNRVYNAVPPGPKWLRALLGDDLFRNVTGFDLTDTPATDIELKHLRHLTALEWLHLDGTQITDAGLEQLEELTKLKELTLVRTQVTDAGMDHLKGLVELGELHLYGGQVTSAGAKKLQQALPDCQILR